MSIPITPQIIDHFAMLIASHQQDVDDYDEHYMEGAVLRERIDGYADSMRELARMCGLPLVTMEVQVQEYMNEHNEGDEDDDDDVTAW